MKEFLLDLVYPKYCIGCKKLGEYLCPNCFANIKFSTRNICAKCQRPSIDGLTHPKCQNPYMIDGIVAGVEYRGIIKKLIYQMKYKPHVKDLARPASALLYEALIQNESAMMFLTPETVIASVPLSRERQAKRGYNQSEEIAKSLSTRLGLPYKRLLKRTRNTRPQFDLKKEARLKNVKDAFVLNNPATIQPIVLIVDDVSTTGATLRECAKVLKRRGAKKVLGVSFARE